MYPEVYQFFWKKRNPIITKLPGHQKGIKELAEGTRVFTCPPEPPFPFPLSLCVIFSLLPGTLLETFSLLSVPSLAAHESS